MKQRSPLRIPLLFMLSVLIGLVGMLAAEGAWDAAFLLCAGAPLGIGGFAWRRASRQARTGHNLADFRVTPSQPAHRAPASPGDSCEHKGQMHDAHIRRRNL